MTEAIGTPLFVVQGVDTYPLIRLNTVDPRAAAAAVLQAYLLGLKFVRDGAAAPDTLFNLNGVQRVWPDSNVPQRFPTASLIDMGPVDYQAHSLTPTALEETWHEFGENTVLWKTAEAVMDFQLDVWTEDDPTREAINATLSTAFDPYEDRAGILLSGDPRYFCRTVRATFMRPHRWDTAEQVYSAQRRLMSIVRCELDVVQLRCAVELRPRILVEVDGVALEGD